MKSFISSYKNCRYNNAGLLFESRSGKCFLDISGHNKIKLSFTRLSGDGKIIIFVDGCDKEYIISSKNNYDIELNFEDPKIQIFRPKNSLGEIVLTNVIVQDSMSKWNEIFKKIDSKYIRMVNGNLYASEGAYILQKDNIENLVTVPDKSFIYKDDKIVFNQCQITSISLKDKKDEKINEKKDKIEIYNSTKSLSFKSYSSSGKKLKYIYSCGEHFLLLKPISSASFAVSNLEENNTYYVTIRAKKLNGNGRFHFNISAKNIVTVSDNVIDAGSNFLDFYFTVQTGSIEFPGNLFKINVGMFDDGVGEILISNISIHSDFDESNVKSQIVEPIVNNNIVNNNNIKDTNKNINSSRLIYKNLPQLLNPSNLKESFNIKKDQDRKFVIIIPSYKNEKWVEKNISSALNQNYLYYRVIFIDDCSPDKTFEVARDVVKKLNSQIKTTLIKNSARKGALCNLYNAIHSCADDEIIVTLDGDDWLAHDNVLSFLNSVYKNGDVWMTYGQYKNWPDGGKGLCKQIPKHIIDSNAYRAHEWCSSHLRTFYAWLFKSIKLEDFRYQDQEFMSMAWDMTMCFPMLEMSKNHHKFISDILYIYNLENPLNDHKVNKKLQQDTDKFVRSKEKYQPKLIKNYSGKKTKIGLLVIGTNKYVQFLNPLISSADRYFFVDDKYDVTYFIFTDGKINFATNRNVEVINIEHKPFPFASMDRFKHFSNNKNKLEKMDYLYYVDADSLFVDKLGDEILGSLVGVTHCGFYKGQGTFETNKNSKLYHPPEKTHKAIYYGGGFSGGLASRYLELSQQGVELIDEDLKNGIMPLWHDETFLNYYFINHPPEITLSPSYHYPQDNPEIKEKWKPDVFNPVILLLEKNHREIRS